MNGSGRDYLGSEMVKVSVRFSEYLYMHLVRALFRENLKVNGGLAAWTVACLAGWLVGCSRRRAHVVTFSHVVLMLAKTKVMCE